MTIYRARVTLDKAEITFEVKAHDKAHASRRSVDYLQQVLGLMVEGKSLHVDIEEVAA